MFALNGGALRGVFSDYVAGSVFRLHCFAFLLGMEFDGTIRYPFFCYLHIRIKATDGVLAWSLFYDIGEHDGITAMMGVRAFRPHDLNDGFGL